MTEFEDRLADPLWSQRMEKYRVLRPHFMVVGAGVGLALPGETVELRREWGRRFTLGPRPELEVLEETKETSDED